MVHPRSIGVRLVSVIWSRCGSVAVRRSGAGRRRRPGRPWALEPLEGRIAPATITVLNANDSGAGSLRAAIEQANRDSAQDTIDFAPAVTGTITLLSALPDLSTDMVLSGPGASALTVNRDTTVPGPDSPIFNVTSGTVVTISGLAITPSGYGAIQNSGTLTLTDCTLSGNPGGGALEDAISSSGTLTLSNCTLVDFPDGVIQNSGTLTLTDCTLSGNSTILANGGGIWSSGTLTLTDCTLSGNSTGLANGGGIWSSGTLTLTDCTLSGNSAGYDGGGIWSSGTLTLTDCTLNGNSAGGGTSIGGGNGGGIWSSGRLTLTDCTLSGNSAYGFVYRGTSPGQGGGIGVFSGTGNPQVTSINSIFANSFGVVRGRNIYIDPNSNGTFHSLGHNLFSDSPGLSLDPTDLINTDPLLGPLADNGGPTFTQALLPGSPAIDAAAPVSGVTTDQRGIARPQGSAPDIGAFESRGFTLTVVSGGGQSSPSGSVFPGPLVVAVTSPFGEPVAGGRVTFDVPTIGASAVLSTNPAIIDANGQAAVTATANGGGAYAVTARTAGAMDVAFTLTNLAPPEVTGVVTPPEVTGVASVTHSKKGINQIIIGFSEDLISSSATNGSFFSLASGVKKRHKLVFSKRVKIEGLSYDSTARRVAIRLAKPFKGRVQVTVHGGIMATNGLSSHGDFTAVVN
jgi:predicted outer membrane repeat protein